MAGGSTAGIIHSGMGLLRLGSTAATGGLGNPVVTTAENGASVGFSVMALLVPVAVLVLVILLLLFITRKMFAGSARPGKTDR